MEESRTSSLEVHPLNESESRHHSGRAGGEGEGEGSLVMSSQLLSLRIPPGEDHRRSFKACANATIGLNTGFQCLAGLGVIVLTALTAIPIAALNALLYIAAVACLAVALLGCAAATKYDGLLYLYFLVLLTFNVLAMFVSAAVLINLRDEATVVRGFAHHHWAQVYSESLSASTKASLGAMCEPARMQPTGAGGAMAGAMAHSVTVANFTACWEQAKPDLNMHFFVLAAEILAGAAGLSVLTLSVMYIDLGLPAIVELTMNGIEALTILLALCIVATGSLTCAVLVGYEFQPVAGLMLVGVGVVQLAIGLWGMYALRSPAQPESNERDYATVSSEGEKRFLRNKKIYGWLLLFVAVLLAGSGVLAFVQKEEMSGYLDAQNMGSGRHSILANAYIGMLLNISGCFCVATSVFMLIQMFGLCFYISRIPDDQTRDSML